MKQDRNARLQRQACRCLPGGVSSPVRAFGAVGGVPPVITGGRGCRVRDANGTGYLDYLQGWGSIILGHNAAAVRNAVRRQAARGLYFGTTNRDEVALARTVTRAIACAERVRFVTSGTEAVMGAVRLARAVTGRDLVIRFAGSYHGHADYLLAQAGSGLATLGLPSSRGVPAAFARLTLVLPRGDRAALVRTLRRHRGRIAAVLVEPVGGNDGVVGPDPGFLRHLRRLTRAHGILLIADEVITGFRFRYGSYLEGLGIAPDLICLGKVLGGGMPVGAYAGPAALLERLAPRGNVYQAATFSGHPVVMAAGLAALAALRRRRRQYPQLHARAARLARGLRAAARRAGVRLTVRQCGPLFSLHAPPERFAPLYHALLRQGVYLAPSSCEVNFVSFAHRTAAVTETLARMRRALAEVRRRA